MGKAPAFDTYEAFLEYCKTHRKWAINLLAGTHKYSPFVFGNFGHPNDLITICAGYRIIADLTKILKPRVTSEYKAWRNSILREDHFKCRICGSPYNLHVHHIDSVKTSISRITDKTNGITLCAECHRREHKKLV